MLKPRHDLSILNGLGLKAPPIGIKFLFYRPVGIEQLSLERGLSFCEMLREAQKNLTPFFFGTENRETCVGKFLLGMEEMEPFAESGQIGPKLGIFQEPRANYAFYKYVPKFPTGVVNYVAFSAIDKLPYDPDVLIIAATPSQAEIVMRATTYSTGEIYSSKTTPVMGCAWIYIYPYQSGKVNYLLPEMVHGMNGRELFSEETVLISIPYQTLPTVIENLGEMKWHLPSHKGRDVYLAEFGKVFEELIG